MNRFVFAATITASVFTLSACEPIQLPTQRASVISLDDEHVTVRSGEAFNNENFKRSETPQSEIDKKAFDVCARYGKQADFVDYTNIGEQIYTHGTTLRGSDTLRESLYACVD
ncbi:MAG: hypothetical protein GDA36_02350 [Rhodobacteraceae bacterium]|nr:hypothetical protein [Paracoccaceae bacterium]